MDGKSATTKYGFRIRTRSGMLVENLMIHGRDRADAQRKLEQMYRHCKIVDCRPMALAPVDDGALEEITAALGK